MVSTMNLFHADPLDATPPPRWNVRLLLRRCGWCRRFLGLKWASRFGVTHGICQACKQTAKQAIKSRRDQEGTR